MIDIYKVFTYNNGRFKRTEFFLTEERTLLGL